MIFGKDRTLGSIFAKSAFDPKRTSAPTLGRRRRFNGIRVFATVLNQNLERFF
jgi:hypothetical protein